MWDLIISGNVNFYKMWDEIWVPKEAVKEVLREYGYKGKIDDVDNGNDYASDSKSVNFKKESRDRLNTKENDTILLFVGQHIWEKNIVFLLDSLSMLRDEPFQMIFICTGYSAKDIKKKSQDLGLSQKVIFTGEVKNRLLLRDYYSSANLFLFPSLYDNAPLVVREAAAMQTPSLLLEGCTSAEIIIDGENGYLSSNQPSAFAEKLIHLLHNKVNLN